jgi:hypothetical protein
MASHDTQTGFLIVTGPTPALPQRR